MQELFTLLGHYTFQSIFLGASIIGFTCGSLGTFAYIKRQGMMGDVISHATLPGVALLFLICKSKSFVFLGGALTGLLAMLLVHLYSRHTKISEDNALGVMLSFFFATGMILLTLVSHISTGESAGLSHFLFGMTSSLTMEDVLFYGIINVFSMTIVASLWKPLTISHFDPHCAKTLGIPVRFYEVLTAVLLTMAIVTGLEMAGVILITSLIIAPATAARQWSHHLKVVFILAGVFGAVSSGLGTLLSSFYQIPTGPIIVLIVSGLTFFSVLFSTKHGLIAFLWNKYKQKRPSFLS